MKNLLQSTSSPVSTVIEGWVKSIRKHGKIAFAQISDGSSTSGIQALIDTTKIPVKNIHTGCSVRLEGFWSASPGQNQALELSTTNLQVIGSCPPLCYPLSKKFHTDEHVRQTAMHLRMRTSKFLKTAKIRAEATHAFHQVFRQEGFLLFHPPVLTGLDCEGGCDTFEVSSADHFFPSKTFLSVSGQLHLEAACSGYPKVYSINPCFRREPHHTSRHLAEFWMVEAEIAFAKNLLDLARTVERILKLTFKSIVCSAPGKQVQFDPKVCSAMSDTQEWPIVEFEQAKTLAKSTSLGRKEEEILTDQIFNSPVFIFNYPASLKPFYMKQEGEIACCFDLVFPQVGELAGGSLREDDLVVLEERLDRLKVKHLLTWYTDLRKYGGTPHGGFGIGLERFIQLDRKSVV